MATPYQPVRGIPATTKRELNRALDAVGRSERVTTAPPIEVRRSESGYQFRDSSLPHIWVKLTGQETEVEDAEVAPSHYSGIQVVEDPNAHEGYVELPTGLRFWADTFPLREVNEAEGLGGGIIVRAFPCGDGSCYAFEAGASPCACPEEREGYTVEGPTCEVTILSERCDANGNRVEDETILCIQSGQFVIYRKTPPTVSGPVGISGQFISADNQLITYVNGRIATAMPISPQCVQVVNDFDNGTCAIEFGYLYGQFAFSATEPCPN